MKLSFIIPCYNVKEYIRQCVESILNCDLNCKYEIILIDDGSSDGTSEIIAEYEKKFSTVKAFYQENTGVSSARNLGLCKSIGEYIRFVDPDDIIETNGNQAAINLMDENKADYAVFSFYEYNETRNNPKWELIEPHKNYQCNSTQEIISVYFPRLFGTSLCDVRDWNKGEDLYKNRERGSCWHYIYKKSIIDSHHISFDENLDLYEDVIFNCEYMIFCQKMITLRQPLYRYVIRSSGAMKKNMLDSQKSILNKVEMFYARRRIHQPLRNLGERITGLKDNKILDLYAGSNVLSFFRYAFQLSCYKSGKQIIQKASKSSELIESAKVFPVSLRRCIYIIPVLFLRQGFGNGIYVFFKLASLIQGKK